MKIKLLRTFLPSKDYETSKRFYNELGFPTMWENDELAILGTEDFSFFLQRHYNKDWAENLMMQLYVDDLDSLYAVAESLMDKYEGLKIKEIFTADYGRTFHIIGPAGVLWHMTEVTKEVEEPNKLICEDQ